MPEETTRDLIVDRFDRLSALVQECLRRQELTESRIESLDQKIEQRLHDTRPMWEAVQHRLDELQHRMDELHHRIDELQHRMDELQHRMNELQNKSEHLEHRIDEMDQRMQTELKEVNRQIGELRGEIDGLRSELHEEAGSIRTETASAHRAVERKIGVLSKNLVDMTADIREIQDRLERLETKTVLS